MRWTIQQASVEIGVEAAVIETWIEQQWVLPADRQPAGRNAAGEGYVFEDLDLARLRLINELLGELQIGEEAVPVVLGLLDQLYDARRAFEELENAIADCSEGARTEIAARLARRR